MSEYVIRTATAADAPAIGALRSYNTRTTINTEYIDYRYIESLTVSECTDQMKNYIAQDGNIAIVMMVPPADGAEAHNDAAGVDDLTAAMDAASDAVAGATEAEVPSPDVEPDITCGKAGEDELINPDMTEMIGYAAGKPSPDVLGAFWLEFLDVNEDARGEGAGKRLIAEMGRRARDAGYNQMVIDVLAGNEKAEFIYRHLGAELINDNYIQDQQGFLVKSKLLGWYDMSIF